MQVLRHQSDGGKAPDLKGFLDDYKHSAGLSVSLIVVGPSNRGRRVREGGVLARYRRCIPDADKHVKTIANSYFLKGMSIHPHNFQFRCGHDVPLCPAITPSHVLASLGKKVRAGVINLAYAVHWPAAPTHQLSNLLEPACHYQAQRLCCRNGMVSVDEHAQPLENQWKAIPQRGELGLQKWTAKQCHVAGQNDPLSVQTHQHCHLTAAPMRQNATVDKVALFHYATKSLQDFNAKIKRGSGMSYAAKDHGWFNAIKECALLPAPARTAPGMRCAEDETRGTWQCNLALAFLVHVAKPSWCFVLTQLQAQGAPPRLGDRASLLCSAQQKAPICEEPARLQPLCCSAGGGQPGTRALWKQARRPTRAIAAALPRAKVWRPDYTVSVAVLTGDVRVQPHRAQQQRLSVDSLAGAYLGAFMGAATLFIYSLARRVHWRRSVARCKNLY